MNRILTMGGASDGALSIGGKAGTEISRSIGSVSVTVESGVQLMLAQGKANSRYNIR